MAATGRRVSGWEWLGSLLLLTTSSMIAVAEDPDISKPIRIKQRLSDGMVETVCPAYESFYFQELLLRIRDFDAPDEFFVLEMSGERGSLWVMELAVRNGAGEMRWYLPFQDDKGIHGGTLVQSRYFARPIPKEEIAAFRRMFVDAKIDQQPTPPSGVAGGHWYDFTHLDKNAGFRWHISNPPGLEPDDEDAPFDSNALQPNDPRLPSVMFLRYFARLCDPDKMEVRHRPPYPIRDMEVLFSSPIEWAETVWGQDEELAVLVRTRLPPLDWRTRPIKADGWYLLSDGKLTSKAKRPAMFSTEIANAWDCGQRHFYPMGEATGEQLNAKGLASKPMPVFVYDDHCRPWQVQFGERFIRAGVFHPYGPPEPFPFARAVTGEMDLLKQRGTWILAHGQTPEKLFDEMIDRHVVTPDGRWLVGTVESQDESGKTKLGLLCYDLKHRKRVAAQSVDETPLDRVFAVCNWTDTKEILLIRPGLKHWPEDVRLPDEIVSRPEFYVLDPAKAVAQPLLDHANLDVWLQLKNRPLQPTSEMGVFWAALPNNQLEETVVGRFREDSFQPDAFVRIPLVFRSDDMWIDETTMEIYVAHKGDLLRFPLNQSEELGQE